MRQLPYLVSVVAIATAVIGAAAPAGAQSYGPGMMGGYGMMHGYGHGMMSGPDGDYRDYDSLYYRGHRYYGPRRGWYGHHHRHHGRYGHHCCSW